MAVGLAGDLRVTAPAGARPATGTPVTPRPAGRAAGDIRTVLVTGATGNVGSTVVTALEGAGIGVRIGGVTASPPLDLTRPETFAAACAGVDGLFLMRPPAISRMGPTLNALVDVAVAAGVRHVVLLSVAGAERNPIVPHHRAETHLRASRVGWTILRPGFFSQNIGGAYRADVVDDDRIHVPAGDGRVAFVDTRDLGEVAALAFADPGAHRGRGYTLTGREALTFDEVATVLSDELGRRIRYEPATVLGYAAHLHRRGVGAAQALIQTALHVGLRRGDAEVVDPTLADLLGRPPRTVRQYVRDHADLLGGMPHA